jgi:hypothetical protein
MVGVVPAISFAYAGRSSGRRRQRLRTFHEPGRHYRASRPTDGSAPVQLHLEPGQKGTKRPRPRLAPDRPISLRIAFAEVDRRRSVKQAGGKWNPNEQVWQLPYDRAVALGPTQRIVDTSASSSGCPTPTGEHLHADA